jgi:GTP cyclohydrolase II
MPLPHATIRTQVSAPCASPTRYAGASRVALLSNNPDKARQFGRFGVTVSARVPTGVHLSAANARYLSTKARCGAHTLEVPLPAR